MLAFTNSCINPFRYSTDGSLLIAVREESQSSVTVSSLCINPFIYAAKYREFQQGVRRLLSKKLEKQVAGTILSRFSDVNKTIFARPRPRPCVPRPRPQISRPRPEYSRFTVVLAFTNTCINPFLYTTDGTAKNHQISLTVSFQSLYQPFHLRRQVPRVPAGRQTSAVQEQSDRIASCYLK